MDPMISDERSLVAVFAQLPWFVVAIVDQKVTFVALSLNDESRRASVQLVVSDAVSLVTLWGVYGVGKVQFMPLHDTPVAKYLRGVGNHRLTKFDTACIANIMIKILVGGIIEKLAYPFILLIPVGGPLKRSSPVVCRLQCVFLNQGPQPDTQQVKFVVSAGRNIDVGLFPGPNREVGLRRQTII